MWILVFQGLPVHPTPLLFFLYRNCPLPLKRLRSHSTLFWCSLHNDHSLYLVLKMFLIPSPFNYDSAISGTTASAGSITRVRVPVEPCRRSRLKRSGSGEPVNAYSFAWAQIVPYKGIICFLSSNQNISRCYVLKITIGIDLKRLWVGVTNVPHWRFYGWM